MIEIKDNGEKLIDLGKFCPKLITQLKNNRQAFVRETVAKMIKQAMEYLPSGYTFIIGDAWRPAEIQKKLHQRFYRKFKIEHPDWTNERIKKETDVYVAPYEGKKVSGHMTGAAVDLRLAKNGRKVPMKSSKLTYQENALSIQPKLLKYVKKNRKMMSEALTKAGLSNFPKEYWHWSYGDLWWAKRNKKKLAIYGKVDLNAKNR